MQQQAPQHAVQPIMEQPIMQQPEMQQPSTGVGGDSVTISVTQNSSAHACVRSGV
jgi:hypothetical protein